ncbi:unnamed protein product [Ectocarpus sp. 6 AP-2014]
MQRCSLLQPCSVLANAAERRNLMKCTTFLLSASIVTLSPSRDGGALGFVLGPGLAMRRGNPTTTHDRRLMCHRHGLAGPSSSDSICDSRTSGGARRRTIPRALGGTSSPSEGADDGSSGGSSSSVGDGAGGLSGDGADGAKGEEEAEQQSLASLVESTFVLAAAGNSYEMGLKAFISTIKEAYERGYTVPALTMEVSFVPTKTAGRDLHPDEVELRSVWIALVYLTLENANWPQKVQRAHEISAPFMDRFAEFVKKVMNGAASGHTLQTLKLEEVMRRGAEPRTPMEAAVLSQSMRIVFATLDLMKEGWSG